MSLNAACGQTTAVKREQGVSYLWVLQQSIMSPTLKAFLITGAICRLSNLTLCKYNHFRFGVCFPDTKFIPPAPQYVQNTTARAEALPCAIVFFIYLHQRNDEILIRLSPTLCSSLRLSLLMLPTILINIQYSSALCTLP